MYSGIHFYTRTLMWDNGHTHKHIEKQWAKLSEVVTEVTFMQRVPPMVWPCPPGDRHQLPASHWSTEDEASIQRGKNTSLPSPPKIKLAGGSVRWWQTSTSSLKARNGSSDAEDILRVPSQIMIAAVVFPPTPSRYSSRCLLCLRFTFSL